MFVWMIVSMLLEDRRQERAHRAFKRRMDRRIGEMISIIKN